MSARLILVHKQPVSARTRFLRYEHGVIAPEPLPALSQVLEEDELAGSAVVLEHPAMLINRVTEGLGLAASDLKLENEFRAFVDTPGGVVPIYLARIVTIDPPFTVADKLGARFIDITEARDLGPAELDLLRRAYLCVME
ncbi:MAG: hypothetical protein HQL36_00255 [Alphaproteobacteria bacterium]|nr:hypothetical protein [Alphaproteobacteria bacterium]MBF0249404.1 hypothetical protein [Alphaproteobacteria bacterium]